MPKFDPPAQVQHDVTLSLDEDVSTGDLTAELLPPQQTGHASVVTRQDGVLCGTAWFEECFHRLDPNSEIAWLAHDGDSISANQKLCHIQGNVRAMLTAERSALNFMQTLSGTATATKRYVNAVSGIDVKIMDTRKTLPGLRHAQKYAVRCGGGHNQRVGLYDGILIKENHITAAGSIKDALKNAFRMATSGITLQIEVENIAQLNEALDAGAKLILLDNFSLSDLRAAVEINAKRAALEASGGITLDTLREVALTGVNRISIGALTKDVIALDLSMRFTE